VAQKISTDDVGPFTTRSTRTEGIRVLTSRLKRRGLLK